MKVRFTSFNIGRKSIETIEKGHTTKLTYSFPHHMMLTDLNLTELHHIKKQCEELIDTHWQGHKTIYLGSVDILEEVED